MQGALWKENIAVEAERRTVQRHPRFQGTVTEAGSVTPATSPEELQV